MQTAIIINDQDNALHALIGLLGNFNSLKLRVAGTTNHLDEGVKLIKQNNPDIVFLDIDQPEQNIRSFYTHFKDPTFKIIFVTAYQQQAIEASQNTAFDYLLKPVSLNDLQIILQRITQQMLIEQKSQEKESTSLTDFPIPSEGTNIIFDVENGFIFENTANIEYCHQFIFCVHLISSWTEHQLAELKAHYSCQSEAVGEVRAGEQHYPMTSVHVKTLQWFVLVALGVF